MLYGHDAAAARAEIFDPTGLGAIVPHVANLRESSGGGYRVASVGSGSGDTSGNAIAGTVGPTFRPAGRNTAIYKTTVGARRFIGTRYQPTVQGPRFDPLAGAGLSGLGATVPHAANIRTSHHGGYGVASVGGGGASGDSSGSPAAGSVGPTYRPVGRNSAVFTGAGQKRKLAYNQYQPSTHAPRMSLLFGEGSGLMGDRDDLAVDERGLSGWLKKATTPPASLRKFESKTLGGVVTKSVRVLSTTAVGAGAGFIASGFNPYGAIAGGAYGFGKGIYGQVKGAPMGRTTYQTVLPAAAAGAAVGLTSWAMTPARVAATPTLANSPLAANVMTPGQYAASVSPENLLTTAGVPQAPAPFVSVVPPGSYSPAAEMLSGPTPVQAAAEVAKSTSPSFLSTLGAKATESALTVATLKALSPGQAARDAQGSSTTVETGAQPVAGSGAGSGGVAVYPASGGGGGGDMSAAAPIAAEISTPVMIVGAGIGILALVTIFKRKRGAR